MTRVMKQGLSLWHLDDLNSKMEIYFCAILRGRLRIKKFCEFLKFYWKAEMMKCFISYSLCYSQGRPDNFWRPPIPEYSTLYAFLQSSYSFAAWSWLAAHQWSLSLRWLGRFWLVDQWESFIQFWKSKRMRRGSPISLVCTIKLPVSHSMTHYIKD